MNCKREIGHIEMCFEVTDRVGKTLIMLRSQPLGLFYTAAYYRLTERNESQTNQVLDNTCLTRQSWECFTEPHPSIYIINLTR